MYIFIYNYILLLNYYR